MNARFLMSAFASALLCMNTSPTQAQALTSSFYQCQNGMALQIDHTQATSITLRYGRYSFSLHRALAADGLRFTDGQITWWSKGKTGFFIPTAGARAISCQQGPETQLGATVILSAEDQAVAPPAGFSLGDYVTFQLPLQAGTGYHYVIRGVTNPGVLQPLENSVVPPEQIGGKSSALLGFSAARLGTTAVQFDLTSPAGAISKTYIYIIDVK